MKKLFVCCLFLGCMFCVSAKAEDCNACGGKKEIKKPCNDCCEITLGRDIKKTLHPLNRIKDITKITVIGSFFKKAFSCEKKECNCDCNKIAVFSEAKTTK